MTIDYQIKYSNRKTLNITVERDRTVVIHSPRYVSAEKIEAIVHAKKQWIRDKINHLQKYPLQAQQKEFISGESLLYLGLNHQLTVVKEAIQGIQFDNGFTISKTNQSQANKLFTQWYKVQALKVIQPSAKRYALKLGVQYKQLKVSEMKYRWGSCTPNNNIIFNWRIIKAPMYVVEYLVVHELTHLLESNHTPKFWNIVSIQVPNYERAKKWLKEKGYLLEIDF